MPYFFLSINAVNIITRSKLFVLVLGLLIFSSCSDSSRESGGENSEAAKGLEDSLHTNGARFNVQNTDSVELYFYDSKDQKEFSRLFISDQETIKMLLHNIAATPAEMKECAHTVKMYLYHSGDVFKTIYASDSCRYLAYAVNGHSIFVPMKEPVLQALQKLKAKAHKGNDLH